MESVIRKNQGISQSIFKSGKIRKTRPFWRKSGTHQGISLWRMRGKNQGYMIFCLISLKMFLNYKRSHTIKISINSCACAWVTIVIVMILYTCTSTRSFYVIINLGLWKIIRGKTGNKIWLETGHPDYGNKIGFCLIYCSYF